LTVTKGLKPEATVEVSEKIHLRTVRRLAAIQTPASGTW
jgi:hypothetical protein